MKIQIGSDSVVGAYKDWLDRLDKPYEPITLKEVEVLAEEKLKYIISNYDGAIMLALLDILKCVVPSDTVIWPVNTMADCNGPPDSAS